MAFVKVMAAQELWQGELLGCTVEGKKVLLVRTASGVHAFEDRCAHLGVALSEGSLDGQVITCRAHHYQYDATTGCGVNPRNLCLVAYAAKIEDDQILVDVAQPTRAGVPIAEPRR